jgi:hypothetical protein
MQGTKLVSMGYLNINKKRFFIDKKKTNFRTPSPHHIFHWRNPRKPTHSNLSTTDPSPKQLPLADQSNDEYSLPEVIGGIDLHFQG